MISGDCIRAFPWGTRDCTENAIMLTGGSYLCEAEQTPLKWSYF